MSKYKERGAREPWIYEPYNAVRRQARRVGIYPNYSFEFNDLPVSGPYSKYYDERETIGYDTGMNKFNTCYHTRRIPYNFQGANLLNYQETYPISGFPTVWQNVGMNWGSIPGCISLQGLLSTGDAFSEGGLPGPDWPSLVYQVGAQLDGHMTCSQNLLVDICQMLQVVRMLKDPFMLKSIVRGKGMPLSKAYRLPANAWLEYKFGWKPLYQDLLAIAKVWEEVRHHQAYLKQTVHTWVSTSARATTAKDNPSCGTMTSLSWGAAGTLLLAPKIKRIEAQHCFSLDIRRDATMTAWTKFDQVVARLGFRDIAEALWDCVPFSFVVDWFTHINREIERKPIQWNSFELRRIGHSRKVTWHGYFDVTQTASLYGGKYRDASYQTTPQVVQTLYERYPGFPSGTTSVGFFGDLKTTQLLSGLALIVQRL
jgi:hypothetical protein